MSANSEIEKELRSIETKIESYQKAGKRIFASSSFQSHSIPLLHILSQIDRSIPVYFLETGFHFPETIQFRDQIAQLLGIQVIPVESPVPKSSQRDRSGRFLFTSDPDTCCHLNKVLPLEPILQSKDIWISGVRKDQTAFRSKLSIEAPGAFDTMRYHPMLNWSARMIWDYQKEHKLPLHPLEKQGFLSIGCMPCTRKYEVIGEDDGRKSRWSGMVKTECGIHTELVK